jgi:hypothetical protein
VTDTADPVDALTPDTLRDELWAELVPFLAAHPAGTLEQLTRVSPASDWWLTESPAVTSTVAPLSHIRDALADLIIVSQPARSLRELLPGLPLNTPTVVLRVGTRASTTLSRIPAATTGDLAELSVEALFRIRGTGIGTVRELVGAIVMLAVLARPTAAGTADVFAPIDRTNAAPPAQALSASELQILEDLRALARWRRLRGEPDTALFGDVPVEDAAPEEVQELATRLRALNAADVLPTDSPADPQYELQELAAALNDKQLAVVRRRMLAATPETLASIAADLGVSRERIRQIESSVAERMNAAFCFGTAVGDLLASLRVEIQPVSSLDRLVACHPEIADEVPAFGVPLWLVLDRLDDYFEVTDGWAAAPTVAVAREKTSALLEDVASEEGAVTLDVAQSLTGMPRDELRAWLTWCGLPVVADSVLTRTSSAGDHAASVLAVAGEPLEITEITARMVPRRSTGTLTNALGSDERFVRTNRTTWALARWPVDAYTSIREMVADAVDRADGGVSLDSLVDDLTSRFDVAASSINTYASAGEFEVHDGVVRRRDIVATPRRTPGDTRRLHRHATEWRYRVRVNTDHLRGSGFTLPAGVAAVVSCGPGETVELPSRLGNQTVRWTGLQPASGTVRRFLDELHVTEGQDVFLVYADNGSFDLQPTAPPDPDAGPFAAALALVGAQPNRDHIDATAVLATAAGLDAEAKPRRILSAYRRRGDDEVASLLERAWIPTSDQPAART